MTTPPEAPLITCPPLACTPRKHYYVSAIDGTRRYLIAGPWPTHAEALAKVDAVRTAADAIDPRAWFMAWGTAGSDEEIRTPLGRAASESTSAPSGSPPTHRG